ncbi:pirin family protein [Aquimarina brevivitae]|uniref:Pirin family protein n=1 Tax=Aquimarina brevivitae TaxID=323412 RepID=A0A4Q7PIA1_9FLAO|nr:pirin family protein [Aquimarina brevivitae]RZT00305.1 hypothetical protein EV197_1541 [Aquimarina brevivitae]
MKTVLHPAAQRGHANHGWLDSYHSFSFANYYDPNKINFGVLRVLNDDTVSGGMGFGKHPHENMEIISIPLEGDLEHQDSMGNTTVIKSGDIQVMSAGTGVFHSEYNKNKDQPVKFLQIWVIPNQKNVTPRYDQISIKSEDYQNKLLQILSPNPDDEGVWIYQNAWFYMASLSKDKSLSYKIKKEANGIYLFVLEGQLTIVDNILNTRDAIGIWDNGEELEIKAKEDSKFLLMDIPMLLE